MHVRITTFHVHSEKLPDARASLSDAQSHAATIPGLLQWFVAGRSDGQCTAVALYNSEKEAEAALPQVGAMLSRFASLMDSAPESASYEVYMHQQGRAT